MKQNRLISIGLSFSACTFRPYDRLYGERLYDPNREKEPLPDRINISGFEMQ